MAYTDKAGKIILNKWGNVKAPIFATVVKGDLLTYDNSNYGWKLADQSGNLAAMMIACQDGVSGDTIEIAKAVVWKTPDTETSGVFSDNAMCAAADVGKPFYVGESGKVQITEGTTCAQEVGYIITLTTAFVSPSVSLSGTALTLSGNLSVGGTLAVTGASTLTGALAANGGITVATGKDLTLVKGTLTNTEGNIVATKGNVTLTAGNLTLTKGFIIETPQAVSDDAIVAGGTYIVDTSVKDVTITLPTAVAGLRVTAACSSATKQLTVAAGSGDKLINASGTAKDNAKGDAAAYNNISLLAVDTTNWITVGYQGTWTYA